MSVVARGGSGWAGQLALSCLAAIAWGCSSGAQSSGDGAVAGADSLAGSAGNGAGGSAGSAEQTSSGGATAGGAGASSSGAGAGGATGASGATSMGGATTSMAGAAGSNANSCTSAEAVCPAQGTSASYNCQAGAHCCDGTQSRACLCEAETCTFYFGL